MIEEEKKYKCQHCKLSKAETEFYATGSRVSPYCVTCNTEATRINNYKREAKANPKAFALKIRNKETQLNQMVKVLREASV